MYSCSYSIGERMNQKNTRNTASILLEDYGSGRISLKKLITFSGLTISKVFDLIAEHDIELPFTDEIDDYTKVIADKLIANWKENKQNN